MTHAESIARSFSAVRLRGAGGTLCAHRSAVLHRWERHLRPLLTAFTSRQIRRQSPVRTGLTEPARHPRAPEPASNRPYLRWLRAAALAAGLTIVVPVPAVAQEWIGTFGDWNAFRYVEAGRRVCYISTTPLDMEPKGTRRGPTYVRVSRSGDMRDVVSIVPGFTVEAEGMAVITVDAAEFRLRPSPEGAVAQNATQDAAMVRAMIAGTRLQARATSGRGMTSNDTYSLIGFTAAQTAMSNSCRPAA